MTAGGHKSTGDILKDLENWGEQNNSRITAAVVVVKPCGNVLTYVWVNNDTDKSGIEILILPIFSDTEIFHTRQ
jgi:hypothetical protein